MPGVKITKPDKRKDIYFTIVEVEVEVEVI
jgi:hypothetical protein